MEIGEEDFLGNAKSKRCVWFEGWQKAIDLCSGLHHKLAGHTAIFPVQELH